MRPLRAAPAAPALLPHLEPPEELHYAVAPKTREKGRVIKIVTRAVRTLGEKVDGRWRERTPAMAAGLADHVWSMREWLAFPAVQRT